VEPYVKKSVLVAEIERLIDSNKSLKTLDPTYYEGLVDSLNDVLSFLNTLEVKDVYTWHLQEKEDIYDAVKDWSLHTFACVMKDGTIQKFTGNMDEDYEGHISVYICGANDDYDNVDDIVKWIEFT
jgi:hypothetical protein